MSHQRLRQAKQIPLHHNQQGKNSLSGGPKLSLSFSPLGRPRRFLAAGLPVSQGRGRGDGSGGWDEVCQLAPSLVALPGLFAELCVIKTQVFGHCNGG